MYPQRLVNREMDDAARIAAIDRIHENRSMRLTFSNVDELLRLADKIPPADVLNLAEVPELKARFSNANRHLIVYSNQHIYNTPSSRYVVLQHGSLIKTVAGRLAEFGLEASNGEMSFWDYAGRMWLNIYAKDSVEPVQGDPYRKGLQFWNSVDGSTGIGVAFSVLRLACWNMWVAWRHELKESARQLLFTRRHTTDVIADWIGKAITTISERSEDFSEILKKAQATRLEGETAEIIKRLELGERVSKKVLENLIIEKQRGLSTQLTAYDVVNALTRFATHDMKDRPLAQERYLRKAEAIMTMPEILVTQK